ncbi:MAG: methionine--tRNA ligase subunit beta [Candidatus Omnitrophota bacterium]
MVNESGISEAVPLQAVISPVTPVLSPGASIEDFKKFKFVVACIKEAVIHPNADKLFVLKVDTGTEVRQLVAGIRRSYTSEQLIGRRVVIIANLAPALIRGVESQGMLLAASDDQGVSILQPDRDVVVGSAVK